MNVLLFGRTGQVGSELLRRLSAHAEVTALGSAACGFERPEDVADVVRAVRPDVIVNAAAYTAVDRAEAEPDRAEIINATAVAAIARETSRLRALLVHYSTDYVFDGTKAGPYVETDTPAPLSAYGRTKLGGERAIVASGCRHYIFRTSWVYASSGQNFVRTMIRLAGERDELRVVDDQIGSPTSAALIADVTAEVVRRISDNSAPATGIYHLAPRGNTSWCGFARLILATARDLGHPLRCPPERVVAIATADYPTPARRPLNSRLCTAKLTASLGSMLPEWQADVPAVVTAIMSAGSRA
jgi:dTDP-4-dehydrorhamnose reductase